MEQDFYFRCSLTPAIVHKAIRCGESFVIVHACGGRYIDHIIVSVEQVEAYIASGFYVFAK